VANLTVSAVGCAAATGGAACPTAGATTVALMQGTGIVIPTLPAGGSVTFTVSGTAGTGAQIQNTATLDPPVGTTDPSPASASDSDTINPLADLQITKTDGQTSVNAGATLSYTIVASNAGPSTASNSLFKDPPWPT